MIYCLIGKTLSHSYSARLHGARGLAYGLVEVAPDALEAFVREDKYQGYNVTIPYKTAIMPYLDEISPLALRVGAVNTVVYEDGKRVGYNTDYDGFRGALAYYGVEVRGKRALVLGTGGAGKMVATALSDMGAEVTVVSRSGEVNYANVYEVDAEIIVNATPVGTYPDPNVPVDPTRFAHLSFVYDLVYNPFRTPLVSAARAAGIRAENGLAMLVIQALEAERLWTGRPYDERDVEALLRAMRSDTVNLVLMGMPSAGKSTVGKMVADALGKPFVDVDECITARVGRTPRRIIEEDGEPAFRDIEAAIVEEVCSLRGAVVALGGGSILRESNRDVIRRTAMVVYLQRDLSALTAQDRPTLAAAGAEAMYRLRAPIYQAMQDVTVTNEGALRDVVTQIINAYETFSA